MNRSIWVDYLKSMITILVVAHHSMLAYTTFARFDNITYTNSTHAIVDRQRMLVLDILQNFNDVFFMSLMFLIGGLFLSKSVEEKGMLLFFRDRFYRLFIPFFFLGTLFMLIAYFPSFLISSKSSGLFKYIADFFDHQNWPAGSAWFIGILFLFNVFFLPFHLLFKRNQRKNKIIDSFGDKPLSCICILFAITWILYVPLAFLVGPSRWVGYGPFDFQLSRILMYYGYFTIGVLIGYTDFNHGIFSLKSTLVKMWKTWSSIAIIVYVVLIVVEKPLTEMINDKRIGEVNARIIYSLIYVASCVFSNVAFLTIFRKFMNENSIAWNLLKNSSYLIYLVHYIFVIWIQFFLLYLNTSALVKFILTFVCAFLFSLMVAILLRKVKLVRQYL